MDVWMPVTMEDYMKQYGDKLEVIGDIYDGARIGLVVPDYVTINSIEELNAERNVSPVRLSVLMPEPVL